MKTPGVVGLGIIGSVWARNYHEAHVLAGAWNRTPQPDFPQWKPAAIHPADADRLSIWRPDQRHVEILADRITGHPGFGQRRTDGGVP